MIIGLFSAIQYVKRALAGTVAVVYQTSLLPMRVIGTSGAFRNVPTTATLRVSDVPRQINVTCAYRGSDPTASTSGVPSLVARRARASADGVPCADVSQAYRHNNRKDMKPPLAKKLIKGSDGEL